MTSSVAGTIVQSRSRTRSMLSYCPLHTRL